MSLEPTALSLRIPRVIRRGAQAMYNRQSTRPMSPLLSSSLLLSSLELSDTTIYEPSIRALLRTAAHFCQGVVLKLSTVPASPIRPISVPPGAN